MTVHVQWQGVRREADRTADEPERQVLLVTMDRPERRNAVDHATLLALADAQEEASSQGARVLVLTGAPPVFSAGADLTGVEDGAFGSALAAVLQGFGRLPCLCIAAVDGPALGAGMQLAAACDLRVATPGSRFGIPAARLGLAVDHWTVQRLGQEIGWPAARAMLLAASTATAEELHANGFVHRLGALDAALEWAAEIAGLAPLTIAAHKVALEHSAPPPGVDELVAAARERAWASADADEGRRAFLEKRPPRFGGT